MDPGNRLALIAANTGNAAIRCVVLVIIGQTNMMAAGI
jgi:hypothetical protein